MDAERPVFYYDLRSPECWLAAERVTKVLGEVPIWQPVLLEALGGEQPWWLLDPHGGRAEVERRAAEQGLPPMRWPEAWPGDPAPATLATVFAQQAGRVVAFSLAAFRQQFAAGRDLSLPDNILIAAAACELHPRAVLQGMESRGVRAQLEKSNEEARDRGVREVPAIAMGSHVLAGPDAPERAAA